MATKKVIDILINATDKASAVLKKNSKALAKYGKVAATTAAIIGVTAVKAAAKFEKQMTNISTLISGDATAAIKEMETGIKSMLGVMPVNPDELGAAAYDIFSAGITDATAALVVLESSATLAVAGLGTTQEATDLVTSSLNAFGIEASRSDEVANILFRTVQAGKTTVSELAQSFGIMAPAAVAAGVTLEEVQAATAAMTTTGLAASVAQTQLKSLFNEMTTEGNKLAGAFESIGVTNVQAAIEAEGFVPLLTRMKEELNLTDTEFKNLISSQEAQGAALSLTGAQAEIFSSTMAGMASNVDVLSEAFQKQTETFDAQVKVLKGQLTVAMIDLGNTVLPNLISKLDLLNEKIRVSTDITKTQNDALKDNKTTLTELEGAIDNSTGANKKFFKQMKDVHELTTFANIELRKGNIELHNNIIKTRDAEIKKLKEWTAKTGNSVNTAALSFGEFSVTTLRELKMVDDGLATQIQAAQTWGSHLMDNLISGIAGREAELGSQVTRVVGIIKRLQFSTNEEMPTEEWGQHAIENFAGGITVATPAVNGAVGNIVTIVNGFGQEVQTTLTDTGGFWQTFTTEIDESAKAQEEMAKNGIDAIAELSEEYEDKVGAIKEELAELAVGMQDIFSEFSERESKNRTDLAEAVVGSEKRAADLRVQIAKEEDGVKRSVLQSQLEAEIASLEANKELIATIESEITEVKRVNSLTRVEKAVEAFKEEQAALNAWKTEALAAWDEQFAKAGVTLEGIKDLWADRTEAVKSLMGEEMESNEALSMAVSDSTKEVVALIQQLNNLKAAQSSVGMSVSASIPAMANGGIVTKPTVALIGEAGPEAIVPLSGGNTPGGGNTIIVQNHGVISSKEQLIEMLNPVIQELGLDNRF